MTKDEKLIELKKVEADFLHLARNMKAVAKYRKPKRMKTVFKRIALIVRFGIEIRRLAFLKHQIMTMPTLPKGAIYFGPPGPELVISNNGRAYNTGA